MPASPTIPPSDYSILSETPLETRSATGKHERRLSGKGLSDRESISASPYFARSTKIPLPIPSTSDSSPSLLPNSLDPAFVCPGADEKKEDSEAQQRILDPKRKLLQDTPDYARRMEKERDTARDQLETLIAERDAQTKEIQILKTQCQNLHEFLKQWKQASLQTTLQQTLLINSINELHEYLHTKTVKLDKNI